MIKKKCKFCGSIDTIKAGIHINKRGYFQRYKCKQCGRIMIGQREIKIKRR